LDDQLTAANAQGRYEIKCLPPEAHYIVFASADGHGKSQQQVIPDSEPNRTELEPLVLKLAESNRMELEPLVLKLANRVLAGRVENQDDKPVSGVNVFLNGDGQPDGNATTDSKGRFHFKVCEGRIMLWANSQNGDGYAQANVEAGDTNVVMTLSAQPGGFRQEPKRASLKGRPLPDLATVNLAGDTASAEKPVLLCLFDAGQRPSRHVVSQLNEQVAALRQKNLCVLGVQAAPTSDEAFNGWKSASPVSFPVGRVTGESEKSKWASSVTTMPWLILTDASHKVVAEGFSLDEVDDQLQKLPK
jgi:hypothetical protein